MSESITLAQPDGPLTVKVFAPSGREGRFPTAILCIDGFGVRASLEAIAARVAQLGYVVALPDLFYRGGSIFDLAPAGTPHEARALVPIVMGNEEVRAAWRARFFAPATDPANVQRDLGAVLDALAARADVRPGPAGVFGYCMGGNVAFRAGALLPDRIGAVASFHGGNLATDAPDSPHLAAPHLRAEVYVAGAIEDGSFTDEAKARLDAALTAAGVKHVIETYPARHGFCVADMPTFDAAAAERHFSALSGLFERALPA
jgi:carboxymethylenebutenolidase